MYTEEKIISEQSCLPSLRGGGGRDPKTEAGSVEMDVSPIVLGYINPF